MSKALNKNDMIRKETGDAGPFSELEYWRKKCTEFGRMIEQIKCSFCSGFSVTLHHPTKSKSLEVTI